MFATVEAFAVLTADVSLIRKGVTIFVSVMALQFLPQG